jgi:ribosomal protein S18 acetylase RimI-like enzyme
MTDRDGKHGEPDQNRNDRKKDQQMGHVGVALAKPRQARKKGAAGKVAAATMQIREARADDAKELADLVTELEHPATPDEIRARLAVLPLGSVLVAETDKKIVGCLTLHVTPVLHRAGPVGRITMLIVREEMRGQGIGQALVEAAKKRFKARGCVLAEVTSNLRLTPAHAFYERLGFRKTSWRFGKRLDA